MITGSSDALVGVTASMGVYTVVTGVGVVISIGFPMWPVSGVGVVISIGFPIWPIYSVGVGVEKVMGVAMV